MLCKSKGVGLLNYLTWSERSQVNQYITAILITFKGIILGMIMGWVSPTTPLLQSKTGPLPHPMSSFHLGWLASGMFLVSIPTMLLVGIVADRIGRKKTMLIGSISFTICWIIKAAYFRSESIIIARAIAGLGNGIYYVLAPIYVKEISDDNIRGLLGSFVILAQNIGFLIIYIMCAFLPVKTVIYISVGFAIIHLLLFIHVPDTPCYLIKKNKIREAAEVLGWLRSLEPTDKNIMESVQVLEDEEKDIEQLSSCSLVFSDRTTLKAVAICTVLIVTQELSGYLVILTYASKVFSKANIVHFSPNMQTIVLGVVQLVGSICATCLVECVGRKPLISVMSFVSGIGSLTLGTWFYVTYKKSHHLPGWIPIAAMCLNIFGTSGGFQPTPFIVQAEMFSYKLRGCVASFSVALTGVADFLQTECYQYVTKGIGEYGTFWIFAGICFFACLFALIFLPETKGKSYEEIYVDLDGTINNYHVESSSL